MEIKKYFKRLYIPWEGVEGMRSIGTVLLDPPSLRPGPRQKEENRPVE